MEKQIASQEERTLLPLFVTDKGREHEIVRALETHRKIHSMEMLCGHKPPSIV